jgi:uncharacterized SAM-dependent methyltransferase
LTVDRHFGADLNIQASYVYSHIIDDIVAMAANASPLIVYDSALTAEIRISTFRTGSLRVGSISSPVDQLLEAYDDPAGVTAAFNRNLLGRLNREFGADFNLRAFRHEARWNERERRIEMHLRAGEPQSVRIHALDLDIDIEAGETIWTESSHKFEVEELKGMAEPAGFEVAACYVDDQWPFAELLLRVV